MLTLCQSPVVISETRSVALLSHKSLCKINLVCGICIIYYTASSSSSQLSAMSQPYQWTSLYCLISVFAAIDCVMSEWSEWSECNKSCGKGHTIRTRMVKLEPQFGGDPCPETIQRKKCKVRKCNRGQANSDEKKRRKEQREKRRSKQGRVEAAAEHPGGYLSSKQKLRNHAVL